MIPDVKFPKSAGSSLVLQRLLHALRSTLRFGESAFATLHSLAHEASLKAQRSNSMARAKKITSIEHLDTLAKRLRTRLKRTMNALDKLEKQRARLLKPTMKTVVFEPSIEVLPPEPKVVHHPRIEVIEPTHEADRIAMARGGLAGSHDDLGIPAFLRRQSKADADVAAEIKAEQAAVSKAKAAGRIAKMKAKKSGETRKMPLTGKAALALINEG
jgi:hypothetical protein